MFLRLYICIYGLYICLYGNIYPCVLTKLHIYIYIYIYAVLKDSMNLAISKMPC